MGVEEIRPGMVGIGRTVFDGTKVEEFRANILGVLENVIGPHRNLILARLEGGPLAGTGVIAGMSGSPVYVDGRLIGAVSYALGSFSKEPIAGITPIAEMTDSTAVNDTRPPGARVHLEYPLTRDNLIAGFRRALNWNRPFADRPDETRLAGVSAVAGLGGGELGTLLRPIATPLVMSGFEPELADVLGSAFREQGFLPTGGSAAGFHSGEKPFDGPLKPGDAVGVMLVGGDLQFGGTGTVTHVDGDRVYAFGHPMYNLGPDRVPDDAGVRLHRPPQLVLVDEAVEHRRGDRHDRAGPGDGHRGAARAGAPDDSGDARPRIGPRPEAHVPLRRGQRSVVRTR